MNKRRLIILAFSLICLASIIGGFLYWQYKQLAEQKLQDYIKRLEGEGYIVEERSLTGFHVDDVIEVYWFSDFRSIARQENVSYMYIDREMGALYFLREPPGGGTEANVFYYKRILSALNDSNV